MKLLNYDEHGIKINQDENGFRFEIGSDVIVSYTNGESFIEVKAGDSFQCIGQKRYSFWDNSDKLYSQFHYENVIFVAEFDDSGLSDIGIAFNGLRLNAKIVNDLWEVKTTNLS